MSNIYGLMLARYRQFPESKDKGITGLGQLVVLASEDAHYSFQKGTAQACSACVLAN